MEPTRLELFDEARGAGTSAERRRRMRRAATRLGELLRAAPALRVRSFVLGDEPVDLRGALGAAAPRVRVGIASRRGLALTLPSGATVIVDANEPGAWARTPFGARWAEERPRHARELLAAAPRSLRDALERAGVALDAVALFTWTTLRGIDLRVVTGTERGDGRMGPQAPLVPGARAWITTEAWDESRDPEPREEPLLVRDVLGIARAPERVDGDLLLEGALAMISLPGRAPGQRSLFFRDATGLAAWSANAPCLDAWDPHASKLDGLERAAREDGREVVTGDDARSRLELQVSMAAERVASDWLRDHPALHAIGTPLALAGTRCVSFPR